MKLKFLLFGALLAIAGCGEKSAQPLQTPSAPVPAVKTYDVHGVIQQISPDLRKATVKHEQIPGYMAAMTMEFTVRNTNELAGLGANDEVTFKLAVTENDDWIEGLRFVAHHIVDVTNNTFTFHAPTAELKAGDVLPDYEFMGENGKVLRFSDFQGRAVAFTFFFTSCSLPEFCPRMNRNFAEARDFLLKRTNAPANWELLSISFDPDFDKPDVLASFGNYYRSNDTNRWFFAVASTNTLAGLAPKVDLHFWREEGSISHNLRTVVLDPNRKIFCQFDGNDWTPEELAAALMKAARVN
ncbi:MAG TPA: copper-binding protein [Verrucomicrobiae bacterium]|nr:copper-binding protein [Verrucomicrobiae bacterium]